MGVGQQAQQRSNPNKNKTMTSQQLFEFDKSFNRLIIGTDEAGRGPAAGGVFASAVCFDKVTPGLIKDLEILNDSKKLTAKKRESIYDVIINDVEINEAIVQSPIKNLYVCPSNINLAGAEVELVPMMSREQKLKEKLEKVENDFHYIIIDCPPSLGLLTINAFTASNSLLIPIQCEYYALEGVGQLINTVNLVRKQLNKTLYIEGVVLTMNDARTNLSNQVIKEVKTYFKDNVYKTIIPRNVKLSEAPSFGMPITVYAPKSKGARCYEKLTNEIIKGTRK